ncbi:MAG: tetratricopeptide repeat protein [bacterium]|nr:tetratricopeptide repeat protein [bacterium]
MFTLLPQFIVLISLATIVVIVLHRLPDVTIREEDSNGSPRTGGAALKVGSVIKKLKELLVRILKAALDSINASKDHTFKTNYIEKVSKALRLDAVRSPFRSRSLSQAQSGKGSAAQNVSEERRLEEAEKQLIAHIKLNPLDKDAYESLGKLYLERKKYKDASEVYEYLVKNHPGQDSYHSKLGTAYFNLGNYEQAAAMYRKAIELKPDLPNRFINLSLCLEALGKNEEALSAVERAVAIAPLEVHYLQALADLLIRAQNIEKAQETLEKILELEPTNHVAREKLMQLKF